MYRTSRSQHTRIKRWSIPAKTSTITNVRTNIHAIHPTLHSIRKSEQRTCGSVEHVSIQDWNGFEQVLQGKETSEEWIHFTAKNTPDYMYEHWQNKYETKQQQQKEDY